MIEIFLGADASGKSLGTAENVTIERVDDNRLAVSGDGAGMVWKRVSDVQPNGFGLVVFALVNGDVEFHGCRITGERFDGGFTLRVDFIGERPRTRPATDHKGLATGFVL